MKKALILILFACLIWQAGCGAGAERKEVEFTILKETEIPDEVKSIVEEKRETPFQFTYENSAYQYVALGYGRQKNSDYVVAVRKMYEEGDRMYLDTVLLTLFYAKEKNTGEASECPYLVLRCEKSGKTVSFQ